MLPATVYWQTDFTVKRVVILRLHDAVARFHTGVKFSPQYNNRGELTPAWHFVVVSCKQMQSHEREPRTEWTSSGTTLARKLPGIMLTPPNSRLQKALAEVKINYWITLIYRLNILVWENSQRFAMLPLVSQGIDIWRMSAEITYWITYKHPDLGSASDWLCCVRNYNCNHLSEVYTF